MSQIKTQVDLFECECPTGGIDDGLLDTTGEGGFDDRVWCETCGWEGVCRDLLTEDLPAQIQTRAAGKTEYFGTIKEALAHAEQTPTVWKVSFDAATGERVRLVRSDDRFVYEDLMDEVEKGLAEAGCDKDRQ